MTAENLLELRFQEAAIVKPLLFEFGDKGRHYILYDLTLKWSFTVDS